MSRFEIVRMNFTAPLHIGKGKVDYDESDQFIHSDTLKAAIFVNALQLFGEKIFSQEEGSSDNGHAFLQSFTITSAFPYFRDEYFFPKPHSKVQPVQGTEENDPKVSKKLKKIAYLGKSYFEDLLAGGNKRINKPDFIGKGNFISDHPQVKETTDPFIQSAVQQRVVVSRNFQDDATTYYVDRLFFNENAGLFFLIQYDENSQPNNTRDIVKAALQMLGENGIGTDRTVGNGQFIPTFDTVEIAVPENTGYQLNLSLYCPQKKELANGTLEDASYGLVERGGWIASPENLEHSTLRKSSIYMFAEGSIFSTDQLLTGKIVNLQPNFDGFDHPVWRDGTSFFLPIQPIQ